jgi:hypothetical protein
MPVIRAITSASASASGELIEAEHVAPELLGVAITRTE